MINSTLSIIILTTIISFPAFSNHKTIDDLIFQPAIIKTKNQWYRFVTCGFIHADITHLLFNMLSLYMFGDIVEQAFAQIYPGLGTVMYLLLYFLATVVSVIPTYIKHKDDYWYRSLGASGAVSAIVFAGIFLYPTIKIGLFILPPIIPGFVFAPIYLIGSAYMEKRGGDNVNHSAHIWGAISGIVFVLIASTFFKGFDPLESFIRQVMDFMRSF